MQVIALLGSLRKASFNRMTLNAAIELKPDGMTIEVAELGDLPPYNQDVEDTGIPSAVRRLKDQIITADAVLFVSPEYNYSVPGVLKNAIDWASRPPAQNPFSGKPCAILSASTGMFGGARMQYHLRQICVFINLLPLNKPEIMISQAQNKFDSNGDLKDDKTRQLIAAQLVALEAWAEQLKNGVR